MPLSLMLSLFLTPAHAQNPMLTFEQVWSAVSTESESNHLYPENSTLPKREVTLKDLATQPLTIYQSAKESLKDTGDLYPTRTKKLIRPNGICLAGTWKINAKTPYTGYFATGAQARIIARASVANNLTTRKNYRSFGLAGKLFPKGSEASPSANFFLIDDNAGTLADHFTDVDLLTEANLSDESLFWETVQSWSIDLIRFLLTVKDAQKKADAHAEYRQLYPLSRAGLVDPAKAITPGFMRLSYTRLVSQVTRDDFREELRDSNYPEPYKLQFDIFVAKDKKSDSKNNTSIGTISFNESVVSDHCDERLRFTHPVWIHEKK